MISIFSTSPAVERYIHPTAIIHGSAILPEVISIGPNCIIGENCELGEGCVLHNNVTLVQNTRIGRNNILYTGATLGGNPQDAKYKGEETWLEVGDENHLREHVTLHRATGEGNITKVGSYNMFMAGSHVGHNSVVGNYNTLANAAQVAGHVQIADYCVIGGLTAIHQGVRIGSYVMAGGCTGIRQDVPPYTKVSAKLDASLYGLNSIGLRRAGFDSETRQALKGIYRILFNEITPLEERLENARKHPYAHTAEVHHLIHFMETLSPRGVTPSNLTRQP
jgi:UDP-N-acetylglucosamine acyltransferase